MIHGAHFLKRKNRVFHVIRFDYIFTTKSYEANININNWAVRIRRNMDTG